jgi:hypothetical protein
MSVTSFPKHVSSLDWWLKAGLVEGKEMLKISLAVIGDNHIAVLSNLYDVMLGRFNAVVELVLLYTDVATLLAPRLLNKKNLLI